MNSLLNFQCSLAKQMKIVIGMDTAIEKKNTVFVWKVIITGMIVQSLDVSISKPFKTFMYHRALLD